MTDDARRRYWTEQMEAAWDFMQAVRTYPVEECGEPMLPLPAAAGEAGVEVAYSPLPHAGGGPRYYWLRRGLVPSFLAVAREMNARGWVLKLEDVFRTTAMQRYNARRDDVFLAVLRRTQWECGGETPPLELLMRRLAALIASSPRVGTHLCGSAMDITVLDRDSGAEVDRGGPYIELSERTPMASPFVSAQARHNRREITALLARHGFTAYPWEFWHYNAGDTYAELLAGAGRPARYGSVHLDPTTGEVAPIEQPDVPLNTADDFRELLQCALAEERGTKT